MGWGLLAGPGRAWSRPGPRDRGGRPGTRRESGSTAGCRSRASWRQGLAPPRHRACPAAWDFTTLVPGGGGGGRGRRGRFLGGGDPGPTEGLERPPPRSPLLPCAEMPVLPPTETLLPPPCTFQGGRAASSRTTRLWVSPSPAPAVTRAGRATSALLASSPTWAGGGGEAGAGPAALQFRRLFALRSFDVSLSNRVCQAVRAAPKILPLLEASI